MTWGTTISLAACCLLLAIAPAKAQVQPETLDQLIHMALERNPDLQSVRLQTESSRLAARAAGALPDPQLALGIMSLPHSSLALDETPMSGIQVGVTQMIPWPGKLSGRSQVANFQAQIAQQQAEHTANQIIRQVTQSYYDWIYWTSGRQIIQDNLDLTDAMIKVARTRYANGDATMQEVLRATNAHDRLANRNRMFVQSAHSALLELQRLVDDTTLALDHTRASLPGISSPRDRDTQLPVTANPLLRQADLGVHRAEASQRLARAAYWPDLTLGVDYRFRKDSPMDPLDGEDFLSFRIGLSLPVWFFTNQRHRTASAGLATQASRAHRNAVHIRLEKQVRDIRQMQTMLQENIENYDNAILPQAKAAFQSAQASYEVGKIDFDALLATQRDWLNASLERLELLRNYYHKQAELQEVLGRNHEGL